MWWGVNERLDEGLAWTFEVVGKKVSKTPRLVMTAAVVVAIFGGLGLIQTSVESDDDVLYNPRGSQAVEQGEWVAKTFNIGAKNHTKSISLYCVSARHSTKNILEDRQGMLALFDVAAEIGTSKFHGCRLANFERLNDFGNHMTQSAMQFWNNSREAFLADDDWRRTLAERPLTKFGVSDHRGGHGKPFPVRPSLGSILGQAVIEEVETSSIPTALPTPQPSPLEDDDHHRRRRLTEEKIKRLESARAFQAKFWYTGDLPDECTRAADRAVETASPIHGDLHCYLHSHTSYRDAVLSAISHDLSLVAASIFILCFFATACFANQRNLKRGTKGWLLGPAALIGVTLALIVTFGLWMFGGGYFHALMGAAIFMVLGLGVDDAFVIVDALDLVWADAESQGTLPFELDDQGAVGAIVGEALRQAGASILVTSATDAFAFAACALTTSIPALRSFCGIAALAVFFDFCFQITWFVGAVALETQRRFTIARAQRLDRLMESELTSDDDDVLRDVMIPWTRRISSWAARAIVSPYVKLAVFAIAGGLVVAGAIGGSRLELDYETKWMAPLGSMVRKAWDVEDKYFVKDNKWSVPAYTRDHTGADMLEYLDDYRKAAEKLDDLKYSQKTEFWLRDSFDDWVPEELYPDDDAKAQLVYEDSNAFDAAVLEFEFEEAYLAENNIAYQVLGGDSITPTHCGTQTQIDLARALTYSGDVATAKARADAATICGTKISLSWDKIERKATQIEYIDKAQKVIDAIKGAKHLNMFVLTTPTLEALAQTWAAVLKSISVAGAAVFVCCFLLLGCRLWAAIFMLLIVASIDIVLVGSLYWIGEYCNSVTTVCLTLAVGLSIDFSAHLTHAYLHAKNGDTNGNPVVEAVDRMLAPILKGGVSTLLAVVPMAFSTSYVIKLFFIICVLIISVGLFFGLLVVPVVLDTIVAPLVGKRDYGGRRRRVPSGVDLDTNIFELGSGRSPDSIRNPLLRTEDSVRAAAYSRPIDDDDDDAIYGSRMPSSAALRESKYTRLDDDNDDDAAALELSSSSKPKHHK